jgi:hypothetical protein
MAASVAIIALLVPLTSAAPAAQGGSWGPWTSWNAPARPEPFKIPLYDLSHGHSFNITVGTPPQTIILLSDWTWQNTWVDTPNCGGVDDPAQCIPAGQNYFNDKLSSTYVNLTAEAQQSYDGTDYTPGIPFRMSFGTDVVCMQGLPGQEICQQNSQIATSDFAAELPFVEDIGGIFGFAPVLPGYNKTYENTPYQFMQQNLLDPVIGWHSCENLHDKSTCSGADALHIMGGTDTDVYDPNTLVFHEIDVNDCVNSGVHLSLKPSRNNYWSATWTGMWIGDIEFSLANPNTSSTDPCNAISPIAIMDQDAFGHGLVVSVEAFNYLVNLTQATKVNDTSPIPVNGGAQGLWSVPCENTGSFPTVNYELSGKQNITVTPDLYIDTVFVPGTCFLNARVWDREVDGAQSFFGMTMLGRVYVVFDYVNNLLGLAPLSPTLWS